MCVGVASSPPHSARPAGFILLILLLSVHLYKIVSFTATKILVRLGVGRSWPQGFGPKEGEEGNFFRLEQLMLLSLQILDNLYIYRKDLEYRSYRLILWNSMKMSRNFVEVFVSKIVADIFYDKSFYIQIVTVYVHIETSFFIKELVLKVLWITNFSDG